MESAGQNQSFVEELRLEFWGAGAELSRLSVPVQLQRSSLYRLTLLSPSAVPDEIVHNGDRRRLGLAVMSMQVSGHPFKDAASVRPACNVLQNSPDLAVGAAALGR